MKDVSENVNYPFI